MVTDEVSSWTRSKKIEGDTRNHGRGTPANFLPPIFFGLWAPTRVAGAYVWVGATRGWRVDVLLVC